MKEDLLNQAEDSTTKQASQGKLLEDSQSTAQRLQKDLAQSAEECTALREQLHAMSSAQASVLLEVEKQKEELETLLASTKAQLQK